MPRRAVVVDGIAPRRLLPLASLGDIQISEPQDGERLALIGHRWWSPGKLNAPTSGSSPKGLAGLLARLLAGDLTDPPPDLLW